MRDLFPNDIVHRVERLARIQSRDGELFTVNDIKRKGHRLKLGKLPGPAINR